MIPPHEVEPQPGKRLLAWIVGVPFFLLPVPLTVDAPDVYGGYGIHVKQGLVLAALGLALGLAERWLPRAVELLRERAGLRRGLSLALWPVPILLISAIAVAGLGFAASQWAAPLGWVSLTVDRPWAPPPPLAAGVPLLAAFIARASWDPQGRTPALRFVGWICVALLAIGAAQLLAVRGLRVPPLAQLLMLAGIVAWPRLLRPSLPLDRLCAASTLGFLAALGSAAAIRVSTPWAQLGGRSVLVPALLLGALVGAGLGWWLLRWLRADGDRGPARIASSLGSAVRSGPLLLGLAVFGSVAVTVGFLVAHLLVELWALLPAESLRRWEEPRSQPPLAVAWAFVVLRLGWQARSREGLLRFATGLALAWAALVLGRVALLAGGWQLALVLGGVVAAFVVAVGLFWPRLDFEVPGHRVLARGALFAAAALVLPVALRYLLALTMGLSSSALATGIGWLLAAAFAAIPLRHIAAPQDPRRLVVQLPLACIALILPTYIVVHWGIEPLVFAGTVAVLGALVAAGGPLRARGLPAPTLLIACWLLFYVGFVRTMTFKGGPSAEDCAAVIADGGARVLLDRHGEGGEYSSVHPYDVVGDPETGAALASFKRWDKRGGFVELIDRQDPSQRLRTRVVREGEGGPLWPERLERDAQTGRFLVQVIGAGQHGLWELATGRRGVEITRKLALAYEPGNPSVDAARRRLVLTYVPNRTGGNPLAEVYDLDSLEPLRATSTGGRKMQMSDYVTTDAATGRIYVPALFDFARFAIVEVDEASMEHTRHLELFHPAIGVAVDPESRRLFVTNPIAGRLDVYDLDSWTRTQSLETGPFPRDVAWDPVRRRLWVADYGDGAVIGYATDGPEVRELSRVHVGSLLRGVGLDDESGVVFAASGCGIFEIGGGS